MKLNLPFLSIGLFLLAHSVSFAGSSEVYKWTDSAGRVHYGEKPAEEDARKMNIDTDVDTTQFQQSEESLRKMQQENQVYDRGRQEQQKIDQKKAEQDAKMAKECDKARAQLTQYDRGGYVWYTKDKEGNRQFMSDDEAKKGAEETRSWVRANCKGL